MEIIYDSSHVSGREGMHNKNIKLDYCLPSLYMTE